MTSENRIAVSHVGSLVRPPAMVAFLQKIERKEPYDQATFEACRTDSIAEAVRLQADAGVDIVSDGEYGKALNWAFYVQMRLTGIERLPLTPEEAKNPLNQVVGGRDREAFPEFYGEYDARMIRAGGVHPVVTGPISYSGHAELQRDIANLKAALAKVKVAGGFLPVVAPASALPNVKDEYYGNEEKFLFALADALRTEYRAVVDAGLTVQIDDAFLPYMYEKLVPPMTAAQYRYWLDGQSETREIVLQEEITGALPHGGHRDVFPHLPGGEDERNVRILPANHAQGVDPVEPLELIVGDDQIPDGGAQHGLEFRDGIHAPGLNRDPLPLQEPHDQLRAVHFHGNLSSRLVPCAAGTGARFKK
jgi:methionine synthase II (cobalamin-independent)